MTREVSKLALVDGGAENLAPPKQTGRSPALRPFSYKEVL